MNAQEFDIDRVRALWPRLYEVLLAHLRKPLQAYDVIRLAEKGIARSLTATSALRADRRVSTLAKTSRRMIVAAAKEDLKRQEGGTGDLIGSYVTRSLDELLQEMRSGDPDLATTAFEAGEELRPKFGRVGHIFVSRHTESTNHCVADVVARLEMRGSDCWYASRNAPGDWHGQTLAAAETCTEGLLLLTREALNAPYVSAEAKIIIEAGRPMFTLLIEPGVRPRDVNMALENWQHHRWYENPDAAIEGLIAAITGKAT